MKVSLCIIATGKYTTYLPRLIASAKKHFLKGIEVGYVVLTDNVDVVSAMLRRFGPTVLYVPHLPWPNSTLKRFHFFNEHRERIDGGHVFYIDADTEFVGDVGTEILSDIVAVQHCGYVGERGTYETRPESTAFIPLNEGVMYFGGGFLGGSSRLFWKASYEIAANIDIDSENGIMAVYHDESHWNRWLVDNPPTKVLSPSYHYPENHKHIYSKWRAAGVSFRPKILLLSKNHEKMRQ